MRRPWNDVVIADCGESLASLKTHFLCLEPHPYARAGAPYGDVADPYRLRSGVLARLQRAQDQLSLAQDPVAGPLQLAIFDAWRPVQVQAYMVQHAAAELCQQRGIDPQDPSQSEALAMVQRDVGRFWAPPSRDPGMPPRIALAQQWISPLLIPPGRCWRWGVRLMPSVRSRSPMFMHQQQTRIRPVMLRFGMEGDASCMS